MDFLELPDVMHFRCTQFKLGLWSKPFSAADAPIFSSPLVYPRYEVFFSNFSNFHLVGICLYMFQAVQKVIQGYQIYKIHLKVIFNNGQPALAFRDIKKLLHPIPKNNLFIDFVETPNLPVVAP